MSPDLLAEAVTVRRDARRLLSADEVSATMDRMAQSITARLADRNPLVVAVMHGGVFTAVELCRRFDFPYEFAFVHASRYGRELTGGELHWHVEPEPRWAGRTVLLVDDILDAGITLAALSTALRDLGIVETLTAVFAVKDLVRPVDRPGADFSGTMIEDVYVFGCGMDYKGYWRGLPELLAVSDS